MSTSRQRASSLSVPQRQQRKPEHPPDQTEQPATANTNRRVYATLDHGILFPRFKPFQTENERRDSERQADQRQSADNTEIVGDQRVCGFLYGINPPVASASADGVGVTEAVAAGGAANGLDSESTRPVATT